MNNKTNTHVQVIVTLALLTAHVKTLGNTKYGWGAGGGGGVRERQTPRTPQLLQKHKVRLQICCPR